MTRRDPLEEIRRDRERAEALRVAVLAADSRRARRALRELRSLARSGNQAEPVPKPNPVKRNPVLVAGLTPVLAWLALHYGIEIPADDAAGVAGGILAAALVWARSQVTPLVDPRPGDGDQGRAVVQAARGRHRASSVGARH